MDIAVLVSSLSIVVYEFDFSLGKVVLNLPKIRRVTQILNSFFGYGLQLYFCVLSRRRDDFFVLPRRRLWETIVSLSERL